MHVHIAVIKFTVLTDFFLKSKVSSVTCTMLESYPSDLIIIKVKQIKNYYDIHQRTEDIEKAATTPSQT